MNYKDNAVFIVQMTFSGTKNYIIGVFDTLEIAEQEAVNKMSKLTDDYYWIDGVSGTRFLVKKTTGTVEIMITVKKYEVGK